MQVSHKKELATIIVNFSKANTRFINNFNRNIGNDTFYKRL